MSNFALRYPAPGLVTQARQDPALVPLVSPGLSPFGPAPPAGPRPVPSASSADLRAAYDRAVARGAPLATIRALRVQLGLAEEAERRAAFNAPVPGGMPPTTGPLRLDPTVPAFPAFPPPTRPAPSPPRPPELPVGAPMPVGTNTATETPFAKTLRELGVVLLLTSPAWLTLLFLRFPTKARP